MVQLTIDGIPITVPPGSTILNAAWSYDIPIPFPLSCSRQEGNVAGGCRLCVVDAGLRVFQASCVYPVRHEMVVFTNSERVRKARSTLIDLLIADDPGTCIEPQRTKRFRIARNPLLTPELILDWSWVARYQRGLSPDNILGVNVVEGPQHVIPEISELITLRNLKELYIGREVDGAEPTLRLRKLLDSLDQLKNLERLGLRGVLLDEVPPTIVNLKRLRSLTLFNAGLSSVPGSLVTLDRLEYLNLSYNRFTEIPDVLFRMRSLVRLRIAIPARQGRIKQVPAEILELEKLKVLDVDGQPIETPPPEVLNNGVEAIRNYWRQQRDVGVDYLCEAKLLILGEGGAGKTSLAKKIQDRGYELQGLERSTDGIEVMRWTFPAAVRVKSDDSESLLQRDFGVHIWDFGGQEIYHATHQFFLSRRSLYVLVADDRKEDTDFNYWLQVIELLSDGSPLLIVQNEKQDRRRNIDLGSLRARFPNLRETYRVNLATNRGLDQLLRGLQQELERLPHIGVPLPKTWSRVRRALEEDARNYIGLDEYLAICQEHGFKRREDKLQLSGYLHDLGICLHFQDDTLLNKTVILKPKWGTDAVYRVLDDRTVLEHHGRFGVADLARIWWEDEYGQMLDELLRLMMKFQLCYELPEGRSYIAPQLLSPTKPAYEWSDSSGLTLRYEYDFMPKGLLIRLIVALHHLIADQDLVWKSGVILERDGTRAEVIEDYTRRNITIRVTGRDVRGLLAIVDDQLSRIHRGFLRLKHETFLPCNCEVCQERNEPYSYSLSELQDFAATRDKIQCRVSHKLVDAACLIWDIFPTDGLPVIPSAKEVFVSYAWTSESTAMVNAIELALKDRGIALVRDKNEMGFKDSIKKFMQRIGCGSYVVVVLSKRYLESKSCMFELTEIATNGELRDRLFPVIMPDANIYDAGGRIDYIKYWDDKIAELKLKMTAVGQEKLRSIQEELNMYIDFRNTIDGIMDILGDMNALTPEHLLGALELRLSE